MTLQTTTRRRIKESALQLLGEGNSSDWVLRTLKRDECLSDDLSNQAFWEELERDLNAATPPSDEFTADTGHSLWNGYWHSVYAEDLNELTRVVRDLAGHPQVDVSLETGVAPERSGVSVSTDMVLVDGSCQHAKPVAEIAAGLTCLGVEVHAHWEVPGSPECGILLLGSDYRQGGWASVLRARKTAQTEAS